MTPYSTSTFAIPETLPHPALLFSYLETLPKGLDSFPGCDTSVSLCSQLRKEHPAVFKHPLLPEPLRARLSDPWREGDFLPITIQVAVILLLVDSLNLSSKNLSDLICDQTQRVFDKPAYRVLFRLLSPSLVLMGGKMRWNRDFRGIPITVKLKSSSEAEGTLSYPPGLTTPEYLDALGGIFRAALEKSRGVGIRCQISEKLPGQAEFLLSWS